MRHLVVVVTVLLLGRGLAIAPVSAAPACDTDAESEYVDHFKQPADQASENGNHRLAMTLYAKAADYALSCAATDTANTKARSHTGDPNYNPSEAFYIGPIGSYEDAASEADQIGQRDERCRYINLSLSLRKYTTYANEKLESKIVHLKRGADKARRRF